MSAILPSAAARQTSWSSWTSLLGVIGAHVALVAFLGLCAAGEDVLAPVVMAGVFVSTTPAAVQAPRILPLTESPRSERVAQPTLKPDFSPPEAEARDEAPSRHTVAESGPVEPSAATPAAAEASIPVPTASPAAPVPVPIETEPVLTPPQFNASWEGNIKPEYPAMSLTMGESGTVEFDIFVLANGRVDTIRIRKSSGYRRLDQAAEDAIKRWTFQPGRRGTQAAAMWFQLPWKWTLPQ